MNKEDKQLLLIDLCARLPYGAMIKEEYGDYINVNLYNANLGHLIDRISEGLDKLVLRPMSSMTEEERKEVENLIKENRPNPYGIINNKGIDNLLFSVSVTSGVLNDWLNAHHFDYRGLIPKGLAIEVTEENNPYED